MQLVVDLQDHDGKSHKILKIQLQDHATIDQLQNELHIQFQIEVNKQEIFHNERRIDILFGALEEAGVKHTDTLVLRHSMIANWTAFVANFELAQQALASKQMSQIEEAVDQALNHLRPLMKTKFLVAYPRYDEVYRTFKANFSRYMDQQFKYIEYAVRDYFSKIFADNAECPILDIRCEKKGPEEGGIQGGLICQVLRRETLVGKYYVKEHMGLANWQNADLRELFVYKLFELIQVGPKVHFIPNTHYSCFGLYIGTEEVSGFRRADTKGLQISSEVYAQRDLLRRVLFVKDVHSKNYGIDGNGKLSIVDFQIKSYVDPTMVHKYLNGYKGWKGSKELRIRVGKDCIKSWKLLDMFEEADAGIAKQKELFKKHSISYKPSRNFDEYLAQIKNNLKALALLFE